MRAGSHTPRAGYPPPTTPPTSDAARAAPRHPASALPSCRPPPPPPAVVVALDPEKLFAGKKEQIDYLRVDRTRERRYDFDHAFGPKANNEEVGRVG